MARVVERASGRAIVADMAERTAALVAPGRTGPTSWLRRRVSVRRAAALAGAAAGITLAAGAGVGAFVAHTLTAPKRPTAMDPYFITPFETGADFEPVQFPGPDGEYELRGWWLLRPETDRVIVACHGYRGSKSELIGIATAMWRAGYNVLMFDFRGHGEAIGAPVTLGYHEVRDFHAAMDYVARRVPAAQIGVMGFSMGATVAILGSADRPEVRAVMADSPFTTHTDVVAHNVGKTLHLPGRPFALIADVFLGLNAGYHGADVAPLRRVAELAPRPLLLIHGTADEVIPVEQSRRIFAAACEPKELWLGEGAPHCGTYFLDRPYFCRRVAEFFDRAFEHEREAGAVPGGVVEHVTLTERAREELESA